MALTFEEIAEMMRKNGAVFTLPNNWMILVDYKPFNSRPIRYLEIGACCGANAICVAYTYAANPYSELHVIDPWEDYDEYPEYKDKQNSNYKSFLANMAQFSDAAAKIKPYKGYSHAIVPTFEDEYFDIIFIDGNHQPEYVLEDGVLSFRKLKKGGVMIFDDYNFMGLDVTKRGIDAFLTAYRDRIDYLGFYGGQIFLRKK